jgi:DNA-binding response OmpR family regulator
MLDFRKKVLLIDDSCNSTAIEKILLHRAAYAVITARSGRDGIQKALAERPNVIVMDAVMSSMTGLHACRILRAHDATKTTPIILLTPQERATIEEGLASGCNDYVTKPINGFELLTKLRDQLGK